MSISKNALLRYSVIDQCLSSRLKKYWPSEDLLKAFEDWGIFIGLRQLKKDIDFMRKNPGLGYNVKIEHSREKGCNGYHYVIDDYVTQGHSPQELMALSFIIDLTSSFESGDIASKAKDTVKKLSKRLHSLRPGLKLKPNVICMEPRPYCKGVSHLAVVLEAIYGNKVLSIGYQKFNDEKPATHVFHPYQLKTYLGRWYVRGYSEKHKDVIILAFDRIESIAEVRQPYREMVDGQDFFMNTIGIMRSQGPVEEIRLSFTREQGHYIKTLYLHHTQQIIKDDGQEVVITLQLIQNYELCQLIMSQMPHVTVLEPASLREKVKEMLRGGLERNNF